MIGIIKRILNLADEFAIKIKKAMVCSFFEGIFRNMTIFSILYILFTIVNGTIGTKTVLISGCMILIGLIGQYTFKYLVYILQSATGYEIFERERIKFGDRLKRFPMGFFSDGNMGNISAVITSDLTFIEMWSMDSISRIVTGYVNITIGCIFLLIVDYRLALISIIVTVLAMLVLKKIQSIGKEQSYIKQEQQSRLVSAVLEYVQGISVIKAFNMCGDRSQATKKAFEKTRDKAIKMEKKFMPPMFVFESIFSIGIAITIFLSASLTLYGSLDMSIMLMMFIFIFQLYLPLKAMGVLTAKIRIMEAGLNRYKELKDVEIIDEDGEDIKLSKFDIKFRNVTFAYEDKDVLKDINFVVPEHSMTALVGPSGCGKTTIANLIARFWDVQKGEILVGGVNIKKMTCDSLIKNISMVFQKVYLFNDTILNNIRFGKPDASYEEIVEAAKKARCHDFIMELENGYDTVVGEGGSTLSGGEKQRISIARAILKDAPIILLDEATASVDPDNEKHIQMAINELVKDKTLVVIAHRLSTIKNADQIVVIDDGEIIQKGTHNELIELQGQYKDFWQRRIKARSWRISKKAYE
ncbi:ABC transporter ATP-binding protein [Clostridiisalibacter paucivorans]|uniref:ABC transporter ATP-binding protein n=1 Tax=Clostridiisalibacter paucivorans TaxID=408753 RepID=UPI00047C8088|nr:ABC transporter ATP-binding protein [Clostridiisalibacter paucivorans]